MVTRLSLFLSLIFKKSRDGLQQAIWPDPEGAKKVELRRRERMAQLHRYVESAADIQYSITHKPGSNAIDGSCLEVLSEQDLIDLGIDTNLRRKKLLQCWTTWSNEIGITVGLMEYRTYVHKRNGINDWSMVIPQSDVRLHSDF